MTTTESPNDAPANPLRILYLHQYFATPRSNGGTRSYEFARRFVARGHEVRMVASPAYMPDEYKNIKKKLRTDEFEGIDVVFLPVPYGNRMSFFARIKAFTKFAFASSIEAMRYKPDVIFATSTPLTIIIPALCAKLRWRRPMVFEVRDLWPELPIAMGALKNPVLKWIAGVMEWVAYHSAAHVVALSPGMADGVRRRGIADERISTIPNSCDLGMFDVPRERGAAIRGKLGIGPDTPLVVYTGTFGHINGVCYFAELAYKALKIDPGVHFLIVGAGVEREKLIARADELGVAGKNLTIWEPLPKTELPNVLAAADIATSLFIPLEPMWHNSANKFFDALAAGKPVAINYGGWQKELLETTGAGVALPHDDMQAAVEQLVALARDPDRLATCASASRELARTRFNRDLLAEQLHDVLVRVAG